MRRLLLLATLLAAGPAAAQAISERPDAVAVVLYPERGMAAITETRTIDLPAGRTRLSFRNVADEIVPQTAILQGLPGRQAERDYDFDLISPGSLLDKAVGERARLVRQGPRKGTASETPVTLRSGPGDGIVLQTDDGRAEALHCSGLAEKLVFERVPPGLAASPTLSATVDTPSAGRYALSLSYLAEGLSWSADYVAQVRPDGRSLDLVGWLTLSNRGATTFGDAPTQVVAGRLNWGGGYERPQAAPVFVNDGCWPIGHGRFAGPVTDIPFPPPPPAPMVLARPRAMALQEVVVTGSRKLATVSDLGDYKLYSLPEPTTLAARQTKQVAFLDRRAVPFTRIYRFTGHAPGENDPEETISARVVLRMQNLKDQGLGEPLPAGQATLYQPGPSERLFFTGRQRVKDTPVGLPLEIDAGGAPEVTLTARPVSSAVKVQSGVTLVDRRVALTLANAGRAPVVAEYRIPQTGFQVLDETAPHTLTDGAAVWAVQVPAGGRRTLSFTVEQ